MPASPQMKIQRAVRGRRHALCLLSTL